MDNRDAMADGSEWVEKTYSLRGLSEFIDENPQSVSIASVVLGSPDSTLLYQADVPRVMGTSSNFFILIAYAMEFSSGNLNPDEMITWHDVSAYQLVDVDANTHRNSYRQADQRGWIQNGQISSLNALKLLAEFNDLAMSDYLWWNLDTAVWEELPQSLKLEHSEMPLPFSGLYLAISPGIQEKPADEILSEWQNAPQDEWRNYVADLSTRYALNTEFKSQTNDFLKSERLGNTFLEERDLMILFPKTTALETVTLMQNIWEGELIDTAATDYLKNWLRWPLEQQREVRRDFIDYGAMFDNRLGLLNGIDFGTSTYTGDTTVQAIFFDRLPIAFWFHMSSNHMHQDFQQRLIFDPAMIERIKRVIDNHSGISEASDYYNKTDI